MGPWHRKRCETTVLDPSASAAARAVPVPSSWIASVPIHPARTLDPRLADFFFVPAYASCAMHMRGGADFAFGRSVVQTSLDAVAKLPWYNRSGGADHVWAITHGAAHKLTPAGLRGAIRLVSNGDETILTPRDIVLPASFRPEALRRNGDGRTISIFFGKIFQKFRN